MTARNDYGHEDRPVSGRTVALTLLLGLVALLGFTGIVGALKPLPELWTWQRLCIAAAGLLISAVALWRLSRQEPSGAKSATLLVVLGSVAMLGLVGTKAIVGGLIATDTLGGPWAWQTTVILAKHLLLAVIGVGGVLWLRPWRGSKTSDEPVSPKTRRTNKLFALSSLIFIPGMLALIHGTASKDHPAGLFSNSPVTPGIALFVIASWLLAMAIAWWWYVSADEHERQAYDFGSLFGHGLFITVTPAWWLGARAGLLPQPDAMLLWVLTIVVINIGWVWRRSP